MPNERIDPGSPGYLLIIFFFLFLAGGAIILLGRSTIKRRRLSNSRKLYWATGVSEYQGQTAVVMGKIIEICGYSWIALTCCILLGIVAQRLLRHDSDATPTAAMPLKKKDAKSELDPFFANLRKRQMELEEQQRRSDDEFNHRNELTNKQIRESGILPRQSATAPFTAQEAASVQYPARKWTSADGAFSVTATFVGQSVMEVRLKKEDGKTINVEKAKLSLEDIKWLQEHE